VDRGQHVAVVGGGIAGLAAAMALAERGVRVTLLERADRLGGRASAWPLEDDRTMSRGFHAFFRQYYNLRALLRRADPDLACLVPLPDYPLQRADGTTDSFSRVPRTPPFNAIGFVLGSPGFTARALARVDIGTALELLRVSFPATFSRYDGQSAADFLDRLHFPPAARDLALEVFARSFFADPRRFSAGELVAMFHTYFLGSAEGLLFDVPRDDYDTSLWRPVGDHLSRLGVQVRTSTPVEAIQLDGDIATVTVRGGERLRADAVVLAADPRAARSLAGGLDAHGGDEWRSRIAATENAPPFAVLRLWLDRPVDGSRAAFLGTSGFGPLDNVSVLDRFEAGAARWSAAHGGSVVELHAYAVAPGVLTDPAASAGLVTALERELHRLYPETSHATAIHRQALIRDDCGVITPDPWDARPGVTTPWPTLMLAGDMVRCGLPVALMERAATTGLLAANRLLERWRAQGHDLWSVPMAGLLAGPAARRAARGSRGA